MNLQLFLKELADHTIFIWIRKCILKLYITMQNFYFYFDGGSLYF